MAKSHPNSPNTETPGSGMLGKMFTTLFGKTPSSPNKDVTEYQGKELQDLARSIRPEDLDELPHVQIGEHGDTIAVAPANDSNILFTPQIDPLNLATVQNNTLAASTASDVSIKSDEVGPRSRSNSMRAPAHNDATHSLSSSSELLRTDLQSPLNDSTAAAPGSVVTPQPDTAIAAPGLGRRVVSNLYSLGSTIVSSVLHPINTIQGLRSSRTVATTVAPDSSKTAAETTSAEQVTSTTDLAASAAPSLRQRLTTGLYSAAGTVSSAASYVFYPVRHPMLTTQGVFNAVYNHLPSIHMPQFMKTAGNYIYNNTPSVHMPQSAKTAYGTASSAASTAMDKVHHGYDKTIRGKGTYLAGVAAIAALAYYMYPTQESNPWKHVAQAMQSGGNGLAQQL